MNLNILPALILPALDALELTGRGSLKYLDKLKITPFSHDFTLQKNECGSAKLPESPPSPRSDSSSVQHYGSKCGL